MELFFLSSVISLVTYADPGDLPSENHEVVFSKLLNEDFETERLVAIGMEDADILVLSEYLLNENVTRYLDPTLTDGFSTKDDVAELLCFGMKNKNVYSFTLKLKDSQIPIGTITYEFSEGGLLQIGYWLSEEHQGKGYAPEIVLPLTEKAFTLSGDLNSLYIACDYRNIGSSKVAEKICNYIKSKEGAEYTFEKREVDASFEFEGRSIELHYFEFIKKSHCIMFLEC